MDILALQDLLSQQQEAEVDDDIDRGQYSHMVPAAILPSRSSQEFTRPIGAIEIDPKAIWQDDEVMPEEEAYDVGPDGRQRPSYEILYKQQVMTEDLFFGTEKDPSSNHCDTLVVKITLPGHRLKDVDLDVSKQKLVVQSASHYLSIYLPYPVLHEEGKAKWDQALETLSVELRTLKENFL